MPKDEPNAPVYYDASLHEYIVDLYARPDDALLSGQEQARQAGLPEISINAEEGRFLQFLIHANGTRRALEIGTLGGYSGTWIARALPADGKLVTLELEAARAEVARQNFAQAGLANRVEVRVGNSHDLLPSFAQEEPFDFMFVDADKDGYPTYFIWAMEHLRPGGIVAMHNAFRHGRIHHPDRWAEMDEFIALVHQQAASDPRAFSTIYPAGDGMLIAVKVG